MQYQKWKQILVKGNKSERNLSKSDRKIGVDLLLDSFLFSSFDPLPKMAFYQVYEVMHVYCSLTLNNVETASQLDLNLYRFGALVLSATSAIEVPARSGGD